MKRKEITIKRLFNIGNYENVEVSLTLEISDKDFTSDIINRCKEEFFKYY